MQHFHSFEDVEAEKADVEKPRRLVLQMILFQYIFFQSRLLVDHFEVFDIQISRKGKLSLKCHEKMQDSNFQKGLLDTAHKSKKLVKSFEGRKEKQSFHVFSRIVHYFCTADQLRKNYPPIFAQLTKQVGWPILFKCVSSI